MFFKSIRVALVFAATAFLFWALFVGAVSATAVNLSLITILYSQPPSPNGGLFPSSWWSPDGSSSDQYVWDNFTLASTQSITETDWMGGYDPALFGSGGPVVDFGVAFYPSIPAGTQPDITTPLVQYQTGGNAGETPAGLLGGVMMYDYHFTLPTPFTATAGTKYWVQIYAFQNGSPDWGLTTGTGGDGSHFRKFHAGVGDWYQTVPGDVAFSLLGPTVPIGNLNATNSSPTALGQTTTFTATVSAGNGISYTWDFGDDAQGVGRILTHTYGTVGVYTAIVTASNTINTLTATTRVTITEAPIAGLTASNNSPTLLGNSTRLTATITSGNNVTYQWNFGDSASGQGQSVTHTYGAIGFYTALVTATDSVSVLTATTRVTITDAPIAGLTASNNSPTLLGNSTRLTATVASGSNVSYQWNFGDGTLGQGQVVTHTYTTIGFYTAMVTASNGASVVTVTTPITVFGTRPIANAGPDQTVKAETLVTLDGSGCFALPGHWPLIYNWQQIGGAPVVLSSDTISRPTFIAPKAPAILTFTLVVTDAMGLVSEPDQVQINVVPKHYLYLPLIRR